jgi:hypothetical protein
VALILMLKISMFSPAWIVPLAAPRFNNMFAVCGLKDGSCGRFSGSGDGVSTSPLFS